MNFANRLANLNQDDQGALARKEAPAAAPAALIEALQVAGLGEWARLHIVYELTHRGAALIDEIARAMLARPLGAGATELTEALVQLFESEPAERERIVDALIAAGNAALDAGGGSLDAGQYVIQLAECVTVGGPLPQAAPLGQRLLDVAATETDPYPVAVGRAKRLANVTP